MSAAAEAAPAAPLPLTQEDFRRAVDLTRGTVRLLMQRLSHFADGYDVEAALLNALYGAHIAFSVGGDQAAASEAHAHWCFAQTHWVRIGDRKDRHALLQPSAYLRAYSAHRASDAGASADARNFS